MEPKLAGTAALVTGASSGIGAATARLLAKHGAAVALVARRRDRLDALAAEIDGADGAALVVAADITDRTEAESAVEQTVERFGRLDTLVNNAGVMLLGPVLGADVAEWERMIAINVQGLLYTTRAALPHLLNAAEEGPRRVADIVNNQLDRRPRCLERLRRLQLHQVRRERIHRVPASGSHPAARTCRSHRAGWRRHRTGLTQQARRSQRDDRPFYEQTEVLAPGDIADGVAYMVTRPRHTAIGELWIMPTDQV
jgi:NADP-dependent 3-hydroxy acid dehydrogenase YdfG